MSFREMARDPRSWFIIAFLAFGWFCGGYIL